MSNLSERLNAYPDAPPESWKPKPGDCIEGVLVEYAQVDTAAYGRQWVATLAVDAGNGHGAHTASVWLSHKVLREAFAKQRPKPGERLGIKRLSDATASDGKQKYARYSLIVDRPAQAAPQPNWVEFADGDHEPHAPDRDDLPF